MDPFRLPVGKIAALIDVPAGFATGISLVEWPDRLGPELVTATSPERLEVFIDGVGPQVCIIPSVFPRGFLPTECVHSSSSYCSVSRGDRRLQAQGRNVRVRAVGPRWSAMVSKWKSGGIVLSSTPFDEGGVGGAQPRSNVASLADTDGAAHALAPMNEAEAATWLVLGIESSCDDTGAAVMRGDGTILGEALASQAGIHEAWGGVVPKLAQEAHAKAIDETVRAIGDCPPRRAALDATTRRARARAGALCAGAGLREA